MAGKKVFLGGNFGIPFLESISGNYDAIVLELSSFQLELTRGLKNHVALITNLSPNHLNRYNSQEEYYQTKLAIYNFAKSLLAHESAKSFISQYLKEGVIYFDEFEEDASSYNLPGTHNLQNLEAALKLVEDFIGGRSKIDLSKLTGLEHRCEFAGEIKGVKLFNDSKSTTVESTMISADSFPNNQLHLMIGGQDKGLDYTPLKKYKNVYIYGEVREKISTHLSIPKNFPKLEDAFEAAFNNAMSGDVVLLSPACASYDQFNNFEERGRFFKDLIKKYAR